MSRAFTKEDAQQEDVMVVARAPLPEGEPNLVTPRGLALLTEERSALEEALAAAEAAGDERRIAALETASEELALRLAGATLIDPADHDKTEVRFGDQVRLRPVPRASSTAGPTAASGAKSHSSGEFSLQIVGVDEADPAEGAISFLAPLAQVLLGARVGQQVEQGEGPSRRTVEVVAIE